MSILSRLGLRWRAHNENDDITDPRRKRLFHWRGRLYREETYTPCFGWEVCLDPDLTFGIDVEVGREEELNGHIKLFGCAFYWSLEGILDTRKYRLPHREIGISFHDGSFYWRVWKSPHSWSKKDGWRNSSWSLKDFVLGKMDYKSVTVEERTVKIPLPEKSYDAKVKMTIDTWSRPRWFKDVAKRAHVDLEKGLPVPGKGENSYDCGDDAIYGSTFLAESVEDAIGKMVTSALRDRWRRSKTHNWSNQ